MEHRLAARAAGGRGDGIVQDAACFGAAQSVAIAGGDLLQIERVVPGGAMPPLASRPSPRTGLGEHRRALPGNRESR
jgi:hypothetical protein